MKFNWDAISALASAIATIAALITIILTIKNNKDNDDEKQFSVQPWFHVTSLGRKGSNNPVSLILLNDSTSTIRIDKINLLTDNSVDQLDFRYLKKDERFTVTGKVFEVVIKNNDSYFGKEGLIEIYFTNSYNNQMKAISPRFKFESKVKNSLLNIENKNFLYIPFKNELIKY